MMKTYMQKTADVKRDWHLIDAKDRVLGDVATEIATKLIGKHKITYTPHIDAGDHVVVINAGQVVVTGRKGDRKMYYDHSQFPGGLRERTFLEVQEDAPGDVLKRAVFNMLPKNKLRQDRMVRLKIYATAEHPHVSQFGEKK